MTFRDVIKDSERVVVERTTSSEATDSRIECV